MQSPKEDTDREPPPTDGLEKSSLIFDQLWTVNIANLNLRETIKTNSISFVDDSAETGTSNYGLSCSLLSEDGVVKCCLNFEVQGPLPNSTVGRFTVAIQDKNGQERHVRSKLVQLTSGQMTVEWSSWMLLDYLRQDKKELVENYLLKLYCKVETSQTNIPVTLPTLRNEKTVVQPYIHKWTINNLPKYLPQVLTDINVESDYFFSPTTDAIRFKTQLIITKTRSVSLRLIAHAVDHFSGIVVDCAVAIEGFDFKKEVRQMAFDGETTEFEVATNNDFAGFADLLKRDKLVFTLSMTLYFDEENLAKSGGIEQFLMEDNFRAPWRVKRITDSNVTTKSEMNTDLVFYSGSRTHEIPLNSNEKQIFPFHIPGLVSYMLTLSPSQDPKTGKLAVNLVATSSHSRDIIGRFRFYLVNNGGPRMFTKEGQVTLKANRSVILINHDLQRKALSDSANGQGNDKTHVRFRCELQLPFGPRSTFTQFPVLTMLPSIQNLLRHQMPTDLILHFPAANTNLHAHKAVLSNRSKYFDGMFSGDFVESRLNQVDMKEVDCEAFEELLWFFYMGKIKNPTKMNELAAGILSVADMCNIAQLKSEAEDNLVKGVKRRNALSMLEMADLHNSKKLKNRAMDVIHNNMPRLVDKSTFQTFCKRKPDFIKELYVDLCKKKASHDERNDYDDYYYEGWNDCGEPESDSEETDVEDQDSGKCGFDEQD